MYQFSMRVEEKATAEADTATGTRRLAPTPRLGSMTAYGVSYQLPLGPTDGQKLPSSCTCERNVDRKRARAVRPLASRPGRVQESGVEAALCGGRCRCADITSKRPGLPATGTA